MTGEAPDRATSNGTESVEKKFSAVFPRNPLISPDSDERIQGNPRKSNPQNRGFSQRNGEGPRKSKRIGRAHAARGQVHTSTYRNYPIVSNGARLTAAPRTAAGTPATGRRWRKSRSARRPRRSKDWCRARGVSRH